MKKKPVACLLSLLLFVSAGCSSSSSADSSPDSGSASPAPAENSPAPAEEKKLKNVLAPNFTNILFVEQYDAYVHSKAKRDPRSMVRTITFLNTKDGAPENAAALNDDGSVIGWYQEASAEFDSEKKSRKLLPEVDHLYDIWIAADGSVMAADGRKFFELFAHLKKIDFNGNFDTSFVTNMNSFFHGCFSLENVDLKELETSGVTDMAHMFETCYMLKNADFSVLDTSSVEKMAYMFADLCSYDESYRIEKLDLSSFDTAQVKDMQLMFDRCNARFIDLSSFNTSSVTTMKEMFSGCYAETLDLSGFDTSSVTTMKNMFSNSKIKTVAGLTIPDGCDTTDMYKGTELK